MDCKMNKIYFRPVWISGRYNKESKSAIVFQNLLGLSYYFEDFSADVLGYILSIPKGGNFSSFAISQALGIDIETIDEFLSQLKSLYILSATECSEESIDKVRAELVRLRESQGDVVYSSDNENIAESLYMDRCPNVVYSALLELTYNCSAQCIHCYNPGATRNNNEENKRHLVKDMSLDEYKEIIDKLYDEGLVSVTVSGGDPLSNSNFWAIIEYLYEKDLQIVVYTNGLKLLGKEKKLASFFPSNVSLSIYSPNAEVHDKITRIKGSWDKIMSVAKEMYNLSVPLQFKCPIMQTNFHSYWGMKKLAEDFFASLILDINVFDSYDGDVNASTNLRLTEEMMMMALQDPMVALSVKPNMQNYGVKKNENNSNLCRAGMKQWTINPSGEVFMCTSFPASIGNINNMKISEMLESNEDYKKWMKLKLSDYEKCGKLDICNYCEPCPGSNWVKNGNVKIASENMCFIAKCKHKLVKKIESGYEFLNENELKNKVENSEIEEKSFSRIETQSYYANKLQIK